MLADVGGTNTRVACWREGSGHRDLVALVQYPNSAFGSLCELLLRYMSDSASPRPTRAALAVAAPIRGTAVKMMNINWAFEPSALSTDLGLESTHVINDFHAQAFALHVLSENDRLIVGGGEALPGKAMAVLGPGTGLGVAGLTPKDHGYAVVTGEGGHATLAAANDFEAEIIAKIRTRIGHCSAERVLSGDGLTLLHDILHHEARIDAAELSRRANSGDADATKTFSVFFNFLGTVAGDLTLTLGALGGTYIAGGIVLANTDLFLRSGFRDRFIDKGRYRDYLNKIPTWLIKTDVPALYGLTVYASELAGAAGKRTGR